MNRLVLPKSRRSVVVLTAVISSVLLLNAASGLTTFAFAEPFTALISGDQEVPTVETTAVGKTIFRTKNNDTLLDYKVNITGFSNASGAHIHMGKVGANGDVIVDLLTDKKKNPTKLGMAIRGNITDSSLTGPMQGKTLADLISAINNGDTYVNVHTQTHPDGEIRGQIQPGDLEIGDLINTDNASSTG